MNSFPFIFLLFCSVASFTFHSEEEKTPSISQDSMLLSFPVLVADYENNGKNFHHFYTGCGISPDDRSKRMPASVAKILGLDVEYYRAYGRFSLDKNYEALITEVHIGYCGTYLELMVYDKKKRKINAGNPLMLASIGPAGHWDMETTPFSFDAQDAYIGNVFDGKGLFIVIVSTSWNCTPPLENGLSDCTEINEEPSILQWVARPGEFPSFLSLLSPGFDASGFPVVSDPD